MLKRLTGWVCLLFIVAYYAHFAVTVAHAETLQSSNYKFDESIIGSSSINQSSSASYKAESSLGDLAIGNSASSGYQIEAGSKTTHDPTLSFIVSTASSNFGTFTPGDASVATANFSVSNYTSYGYAVQIAGTPPTNGVHTLPGMATTGPSQIGDEQFGINLVANTLPTSVGANPDNGQFGFGSITANYSTPNQYRYVSGETIALAPKSSGVTTYTISYMANVAGLTPGGQYTSNQTVIVTGTY